MVGVEVYRLTGDSQDRKQRGDIGFDLFELVGDALGAFAGSRGRTTDDHHPAHPAERVEQALDACVWCVGATGTQVQKVGEQEAENAGEHVDVQLLVGPVVLRPKSHMSWILEVSEDRLDCGLTVVGTDDVRSRPVVVVGHEDDAAERVARESVERSLVELVGEGEMGVLAGELEADDLGEVLASVEVVLDIALDSGTVAPLPAALEHVCELAQPLLRFCDVLHHAGHLALA